MIKYVGGSMTKKNRVYLSFQKDYKQKEKIPNV